MILFFFIAALSFLLIAFIYLVYIRRRTAPRRDPSRIPRPDSEETYYDPRSKSTFPFPSISEPATLDLSVIVPAYNESDRLPAMMNEALKYLIDSGKSWEIIIVDDGSSDNTAQVALQFVETYGSGSVRLLQMQRNTGKGGAVKKGMSSARGRWMLMVDADGATRFSDLKRLESAVKELEADVAIGSRAHLRNKSKRKDKGRELLRGVMSVGFNWIVWYVGGVKGIADTQCGFKLYSRAAAKLAFLGQNLSRWAFDVENVYRVQIAGMKVVEVPVMWTEIPGSKISLVKATINMFLDMMIMRYYYSTGRWAAPTLSKYNESKILT